MSNYSTGILDISAVAAYPSNPSVTLPFEPSVIRVTSEGDAASQTLVSFDGVNDHAVLVAGTLGLNLAIFNQKLTKIWLKRGTGANHKAQVVAYK